MIDVMLRAFTRARFRQFAVAQNLIHQEDIGDPPVSHWIIHEGVSIDEIGNALITPGTFDTSTFPPTELTPPVMDTWWLVNLRMTGQRADDDEDPLFPGEEDTEENRPWRFLRSKFVRAARQNPTLVTTTSPWGGKAFQFGTGDQRIQLLDPRDAAHAPKRVWLGGMAL